MISGTRTAPIWRMGVLAILVLTIGVDALVSLNDAPVVEWTMQQQWMFVVGAVWVFAFFVAILYLFGRNDRLLQVSYVMFVLGIMCANFLILVLIFNSDKPTHSDDFDLTTSSDLETKYDPMRERWCSISGGVFNVIVFVASWRPRGASSNVKLQLSTAAAHVRPVLGEIIFNTVLTSMLWGVLVIVRNDVVWDMFLQAYLCLYAACNSGVPSSWSITQRLVAVFVWPVLGFVY